MITEIIKVTMYLASFIVVIFLAFFFTKYLARKSSSLNKSKNTKIIEIIPLGNNTRIIIVEIFSTIYIIYDNNSNLLLLDKLRKEDVNIQVSDLTMNKDEINNIIERALMKKDSIVNKFRKKE